MGGTAACRLSYKATQQRGFLLTPGISDEYLMRFRDRRFISGFLWGGFVRSTFKVENSGDDAVFTSLFPRKIPFYLAADFESLMMC